MNSGYLKPIGVRSLSRNAQEILNEMSYSNGMESSYSHKYHQNKLNNHDKKFKFYQKQSPFQKNQNQV